MNQPYCNLRIIESVVPDLEVWTMAVVDFSQPHRRDLAEVKYHHPIFPPIPAPQGWFKGPIKRTHIVRR